MREILFKAKRIDNGEWVEGWIVPTMHNTYHYGYRIIETCGINYDELDFWEPSFISWEVDENTICQFTGLTDKNGNKIWENDIVVAHFRSNKSRQKFKIIFEDGMFLFDNSCVEVPKYDVYGIEVIGNIFNNPELLGEKNG